MLDIMKPSLLWLVLLWALGVADAFRVYTDADEDSLQPIATRSQERRICVELCSAALGGPACGDDCVDLIPAGLPLKFGSEQNDDDADTDAGVTRREVCQVLCENSLGYPLCQCEQIDVSHKNDHPDYFAVCSTYCNTFNYRLNGCQKCTIYNSTRTNDNVASMIGGQQLMLRSSPPNYNWEAWCHNQCHSGNGGAACNCDILPMSLQV